MSQMCLFICDLEFSLFPLLAMAAMHSTNQGPPQKQNQQDVLF